ncbi:MAG: amino acid ABC transporter permease [Alphaproteobacteria bacterium]|nr:amino acid ABC transporter permease [Alphaproteobacteria bacterium]
MNMLAEMPNLVPILLSGMQATLILALSTILIGTCVGTVLGCLAVWGGAIIRILLYALVTIARGVPLVVQVFAVFFVLPVYGIQFSAMTSAAIALSVFASLTIMEIVRAGIKAVSHEQYQAALSLGFSFRDALMSIVFPQALRIMIPGLVNQGVFLVKATSVVSLFGVTEFMFVAKEQIERTLLGFEIMAVVWIMYTLICFPLTQLGRTLEARLNVRGAAQAAS